MTTATILVVEDEPSLNAILTFNLEKEGYAVLTSQNGADALTQAQSSVPDLIILDIMLPGLDGLEVCRQLRGDDKTKGIRILLLTARDDETDEIVGFKMGADDYVTKPFKIKPLMSRIRALLRRSDADESGEVVSRDILTAHAIVMDRGSHTATAGGNELILTLTEFRLLWTLMKKPGRAFSRFDLMESIRGDDANALERTIDVHIRSLRKKLGDRAKLIETVRGIGYRFARE